jgi:hypothetical protein
LFDLNYVLPVTRYAPPSGLRFDSVSRIARYDVSVPFKIKGGRINNVTYFKGVKQGSPGFEYYVVSVQRFLGDPNILYIGQTATDHQNRMDSVTEQKGFTDLYFVNRPGRPPFKSMWSTGSSFFSSNTGLSRGNYRIGMTEDLDYSHSSAVGLDYYTNVYSMLRSEFVYSTTGNFS